MRHSKHGHSTMRTAFSPTPELDMRPTPKSHREVTHGLPRERTVDSTNEDGTALPSAMDPGLAGTTEGVGEA